MSESANTHWRSLTVSLMGLIVGGVTTWTLFAGGTVSRDEVARMIEKETPYLADRKAIQESLARTEDSLRRLSSQVELLMRQQVRLESRLDQMLSQRSKSNDSSE